jgi:flavorubredoxin
MTRVDEIAPDVFRISTLVPEINLQFNQFLVRDEEPLLYHTGLKQMFPLVREAVASLIDPAKLRWISFSHFESDECGGLNEWLTIAPQAQAVTPMLGALISVNDFAIRPAHILNENEILNTGKNRFRLLPTPHVPHGWDASLLFEETNRTLFTSDLFHQGGEVEPLTSTSVLDRVRQVMLEYQSGPFSDYLPFRPTTETIFDRLADLNPVTLAMMHGSSYTGNARQELLELKRLLKEVLN